ncbi:MAG: glycoside hydrolase family 10 protein [Gemmata sp.]
MFRLFQGLLALGLCAPGVVAAGAPPAPNREFRAVWVATVANIDWPSKPGLPAEQQKAELLAILDKSAALNLNAVVFQVRPMADALYESKLEPWSEYLTGQLGKGPGYDPLAVAVEEAHKRGMELHAWFNPYRARHPSAKSEPPTDHITKARPDLAKPYGTHSWMNPTHKEVQDHSLAVVLDVVKRYDIDGIHIDDYFYPYKEKDAGGMLVPFPDDDTWQAYQKIGGKLTRDDWRRDAVNGFVKRMYEETKKAKPWVKVGISPFGIWRPGNPPGISGLDQYTELYADAKLWLNEGWVDTSARNSTGPSHRRSRASRNSSTVGRARTQGSGTCGRVCTQAE